jgi:CRISPR-associated protein Csb2
MEEDPRVKHLILTCVLTENHFHGIRMGRAGEEECDWPPSPGRVFQSLINAAFAGVPAALHGTMHPAERALEWLERQAPPVVVARDALPEFRRKRLQTALPLNNKKDSDLLKSGLQLAPLRRISGYDLNGRDARVLEIRYLWQLQYDSKPPLDTLDELASRVSYFGRAEDRVEMEFRVVESLPDIPVEHSRWLPSARNSGLRLGVPRPHSLKELRDRHDLLIPARTRKPNALSCLSLQAYQLHDEVGFPQPVQECIVNLVSYDADPDGVVQSFDPLVANKFRAWLRAAIIRVAREEIHWADPAVALEFIAGHMADSGSSKVPHLAIVPVPSLHRNGQADGQVRRFALLGYAAPEHASRAASIYQTLFRSLDECSLIHDGEPSGLFARVCPADRDKTWASYKTTSPIWVTCLPIAFTSTKFDVCKALTGNAKHLKRQEELARLIRRALRIQGIPASIADDCSVQVSATPFLPRTQRAEKYSATGKSFRIHARLTFPCPVEGPVILGDGRYSGMGLCFPV